MYFPCLDISLTPGTMNTQPAATRQLTSLLAVIILVFTGLLPAIGQQPPARTISISGAGLSDSRRSSHLLDSNWKFHRGDIGGFEQPSFDDNSWETVVARVHNDTTLLHKGAYSRVDCYRLHLDVDSAAASIPVGIEFMTTGAAEIFLDGRKLKSFGSIGPGSSRRFMVTNNSPFLFIFGRSGPHVLAVRFANYSSSSALGDKDGGQTGFSMSMSEANRTMANVYYTLINNISIAILLGTIFAVLFFSHLLLYLFYRSERSNLFFSIFCLSVASLLFIIYLIEHTDNADVMELYIQWAITLTISVMFLSFSGLNNEIFGKKRLRYRIIILMSLLCFVINSINGDAGGWSYAITGVVVLIEGMVMPVVGIVRKRRGARIVGSGVLFFTLFFFSSVLTLIINKQGLSFDPGSIGADIFLALFALAILSIPLSMSIYLSWNFASVSRELKKSFVRLHELSNKALEHEQEKKKILEEQNEYLEQQVAQRTAEIEMQRDQLAEEKKKSDDLLLNILPEEVAEELKQKGSTEARVYEEVTVLFTDFVDFTKAGEEMPAQELVSELNACFRAFDEIIARHGIEKIKTIGDAYLAVCGLPAPHADHAARTVRAAKDIIGFMTARRGMADHRSFEIRIGIHSGSVVAGIVGLKKFAYDIWGDTVNTAARIEEHSEPGKINISQTVYDKVKDQFKCTHRGYIKAKNKGELSMYFVEG